MLGRLINSIIKKVPIFVVRKLISCIRNSESAYGYQMRSICYTRLCKSFGEKVKIAPYVFLQNPEHISIGNNVSIQHFCLISGYGGVEIGSDVSIAAYTSIFSTSHPVNNPHQKIRDAQLLSKSVKIGENVWIGAGVTILYGTTITDGVVVGAQSLVTKDLVQKDSVYIGSPAKFLKLRFNEQ